MELIAFDRDAACPACGIGLEIRAVCREWHADLDLRDDHGIAGQAGHLHVACPGCGWSGFMATASRDDQDPEASGGASPPGASARARPSAHG